MATSTAEKDGFKLTSEEAKSLKEALKRKEFRDLLAEYAKEISDPKNKKIYEDEIAKLEKERGVDVKFVHSKPGHVLKTCILPSKKKLFINLSFSDLIEKATPQGRKPDINPNGQMWSIPYSLTPPRDDIDKANNKITIVDAIFNTDTYKKAIEERMFNNLLEVTALDGVEKDLKIKIDRKHVKKLKQPYKGTPHPTVLRKQTEKKVPEPIGPLHIPYPPLKQEENRKGQKNAKKSKTSKTKNEPKYTVTHRGELDYQDFTNERTSNAIKRPKELVVTVELPGLSTAANLEVDIFEKSVILNHVDPSYHLELSLSYPVDDEKSVAKFNKMNSTLVLTLPVQSLPPGSQPSFFDSSIPDEENLPESDTPPINGGDITDSSEELTNEIEAHNGGGMSMEQLEPKQEVKSDWSVQGEWVCPRFSYRQEVDVVSYILHVPHVNESTLIKHFDENMFHITFGGDKIKTADEISSKSYSFFVQFPTSCLVDVQKCHVEISEENVAVVIAKRENEEKSGDMWKSFFVGISSNQTEEKFFMTEENLLHDLKFADPWQKNINNFCSNPSVNVMTTNCEESVVTISNNPETLKNMTQTVLEEMHSSSVSNGTREVSQEEIMSLLEKANNHRQNGLPSEQHPALSNHDNGLCLTNALMFDLD